MHFFKVAAVGHLRHDVGAAQQTAYQLVTRRDPDLACRHLVARVVQHARSGARVRPHAEGGQIRLQVMHAAPDMGGGVFRAVLVAGVLLVPQVAYVVVERRNDAQPEHMLIELGVIGGAFAAIHQASHRQRHIQHVLNVVVIGVASVKFGVFATIQARQAVKRLPHRGVRVFLEKVPVNTEHFPGNLYGIGGVDPVGYIVLVAAVCCHPATLRRATAIIIGQNFVRFEQFNYNARRTAITDNKVFAFTGGATLP